MIRVTKANPSLIIEEWWHGWSPKKCHRTQSYRGISDQMPRKNTRNNDELISDIYQFFLNAWWCRPQESNLHVRVPINKLRRSPVVQRFGMEGTLESNKNDTEALLDCDHDSTLWYFMYIGESGSVVRGNMKQPPLVGYYTWVHSHMCYKSSICWVES